MAYNPVNGQKLDDRFEYPVVNGPTWERLCDGLKYQSGVDHVEVRFSYQQGPEQEDELTIRGRVWGISSPSGNPSTNPTVLFVPETDCSTYPVPWEVSYWPNRKQGVIVNVKLRNSCNARDLRSLIAP